MNFRYDVLRLDGSCAERTPQGGLRVPAFLTRAGVFEYRNANGSVRREYRPPTEVFDAQSLCSLEDAPVTDGHQGAVRPDSFQSLAKGHVRSIKQDGQFVAGVVLVQDAALVAAVERGERREVSCGYECRLDMTPGTTPDGEAFDAIQRNIKYNHCAMLPVGAGRAGREVALRLDSAGDARAAIVLSTLPSEAVIGSAAPAPAWTSSLAFSKGRSNEPRHAPAPDPSRPAWAQPVGFSKP